MKKLSFILTITIGLVLSSCSVGRYANPSQNLNLNQTQIVLSEANFKVVKHVSLPVIYTQSSMRFDSDQLKQGAYAELLRKANLTGSQALINVTVELVERKGNMSGKKEWAIIASGIVIEFINPNAPQDDFVTGGAIGGGSLSGGGTIQSGGTIQTISLQDDPIEADHTDKSLQKDTRHSQHESSEDLLKLFFAQNKAALLIVESDDISEKENTVLRNTFMKKANYMSKYLSCKFRLTEEKQRSTIKLVIGQVAEQNMKVQCIITDHNTQETVTLDLGTGTVEDLGYKFARRVKYYTPER